MVYSGKTQSQNLSTVIKVVLELGPAELNQHITPEEATPGYGLICSRYGFFHFIPLHPSLPTGASFLDPEGKRPLGGQLSPSRTD